MNVLSDYWPVLKQGPRSLFRNLLGRQRVRQTALLYSSEIGLIVLTFGTGILNSRFLGPEQYGLYTFVITVVEALMIFSGFGFPQAGARVVALAKSRHDEQAMQGALVVVAVVIGLAMSVVLTIASPFIESTFDLQHKHSLVLASLISTIAPLTLMLMQACRGGNQIGILAGLKILPKGLYLIGALGVVYWSKLEASGALLLYFGGALGACLFAMFSLRIRFVNVRSHVDRLKDEVRRYGFKAYIGGIADNSTFKLNNLLIAGYVDTTWLGFYSIASTMVSPMVSFSTSLSNSVYRSLATKDRIDRKVFLANGAFLLASGVFTALCARPLIAAVLTPSFLPATGLVYILIFTAFFQGMYQPINAFLGSHGRGRESRSISFFVCVVNLGVAVALIPRMGAHGAALGSALAKLCELLGNIYFYRKVTRELRAKQPA